MAKPRILIASGCSFTQFPGMKYTNWPFYLNKSLGTSAFYLGTSASDNSLIANKTIHSIQQCFNVNKLKPEDMLVGVMWSGLARKSVYLSDNSLIPNERFNPHRVAGPSNYYLINFNWGDELSTQHYKYFHDDVGCMIDSIKNMLLVQNICKLYKIKYFFTEYSHDTVTNSKLKSHPDIRFFYEMLDKEQFLPIKNMREWCVNDSNLEYETPQIKGVRDDHPTSEMSEAFADRVIIPWLKNKRYID